VPIKSRPRESGQPATLKTTDRNLERLAARYGWSLSERREIRALLQHTPEIMGRYWRNLAIARSEGFVQTPANEMLTLRAWCAKVGHPDPTWHDLDTGLSRSGNKSITIDMRII
jgi:hypothetical protein